ncbi:MAG TPA: TfpX/TfpZ family type IV pilin accessory protein [Usitatibacter sp.]|nr:TfpX/TfpZ family type IV pilin accessory protein [Usitatibacter sp.]
MKNTPITRWQAAPIHLAISATIAAIVFSIVYFVWYPGAMYDAAGGRELFLLIACVDVTVGPLVTLIIYRPGKRGLKFDLAVIAIVQFSALCYGAYVLFDSRPAWIVYVKDRYELVRANQIMDAERAKAKPPFNALPITGPRLVGAELPKDPNEQLRIMLTAAAGQDVQTYPQYYVPYDKVKQEAIAHAKPLAALRKLNPGQVERVDALPGKLHLPESRLGFLPMRAGKRDLAVIIDRSNGDYLGNFSLRPWRY